MFKHMTVAPSKRRQTMSWWQVVSDGGICCTQEHKICSSMEDKYSECAFVEVGGEGCCVWACDNGVKLFRKHTLSAGLVKLQQLRMSAVVHALIKWLRCRWQNSLVVCRLQKGTIQQGAVAATTMAVKLKMWRSCWRPRGNGYSGCSGRLSRRRRGVGAGSAGPCTIRSQPAAAEATGEAHPFLHRFFPPLSARIHVSDFSWPNFHPSPHLRVWKFPPLRIRPRCACRTDRMHEK